MNEPKLTEEEKEIYLNIMIQGNIDDMFDFAYALGRGKLAEEQLKTLNSK